MLYLFKLLLLLIKIDEETVLKWFGMADTPNPLDYIYGYDIPQKSTDISLTTFQLIVEGLWNKVQDGLTLADIENILFFILFIRFVILAIRYNLKTSFFITCIGLCAGYLWYRHLIDLISMYRNVLLKLPYLNKLGRDAVQLRSLHRQMYLTDLKMGDLTHWYNPGQVIYNGFTKGIVHIDPESGQRFYIDPISMIISNLPEPIKSSVIPVYYKIYNGVIPKMYNMCTKFWNQLSGIAAYALITRIGKRYCPYLIRWHWTLLLIMGMVESFIIYFIYRAHYFQTYILLPQKKALAVNTGGLITSTLDIDMQMQLLNACICTIVLAHLGFVIFALFHAVWGQYFYFPFFVENTELHVGPRPANSIYSGGQTAWQTPEEKKKLIPKLWYGWFGRGTKNQWNFIGSFFTKVFKKFFRKKKKR
jgi:hypothetical protein